MGKNVTRLYEQFQPEWYGLSITLNPDDMSFSGQVVISGRKVGRPSQRLTFHQKELTVTSAIITKHDKKGDQTIEVGRINNQDSLNEVRIHAAEKIFPGEYTVTLEYEGKITRPMNGIYPCFFKHEGKDMKLIATQFESHHAREAFPCIDEPEAKAKFDLSLITPEKETLLANTPVREQVQENGKWRTYFETTPRMSTYLLAFVYGEMGYKETVTKDGIHIRSYSIPDYVKLTDFSLEVAKGSLEFFSDYFGMPYPMQKLDLVALPDFSSGAMENWGLMTFREVAMLVDPKASSIESKQQVAMVVAHEVSHQWFGNLVTMKWWDDLWLNESFANMMEYRAVNELYPEWNIWEQFISHETVAAKRRDSLADVQPVRVEVRHPDEISTIFDPSIVYAKGGSLLYMVLNYIGEDAFRSGLKEYFKQHAYGNTQAADLWHALGRASGKDLNTFMQRWLTAPGYPLITAEWTPGSKEMQLTQRRFYSDPKAHSTDTDTWQVPLAPSLPLNEDLFAGAQSVVKCESAEGEEPLLLNHDGVSYFLPYYANAKHLASIVDGLKAGKVSDIDRFLLLDNYILLQRGGVSQTTELLELLQAYESEQSETVWGAIAMSIGEARKLIEYDEKQNDNMDRIVQRLVVPMAEKLGWNDEPDDDAQTLRLRGLAVSLAAGAKHQPTIDEGLKRFAAFKQPSELAASTRGVVYFCGARYGSDTDYEKLIDLHNNAQNADERDELAGGITAAKAPARFNKALGMLKGEAIRRQDLMHWYAWLLRNRYSRAAAWEWMVANWQWLEQEFSSDKSYGYFARFGGGVFSRDDELKQFMGFFDEKKSVIALARDITLAEQEIQSRIAWRDRNESEVKDWLKSRA